MINDIDIPLATIYAAMDEMDKIQSLKLGGIKGGCWGLYVIHATKSGILKSVEYIKGAEKSLN